MIYNLLYDWQKQIVDSLSKKVSFGLWLDCGLGKTVQALALAEQNQSTKVLIVTPNCKASESVDTPGSWQQWAMRLGPDNVDWVVHSKGDKYPVHSAQYNRASVSASPDKKVANESQTGSQTECLKSDKNDENEILKSQNCKKAKRQNGVEASAVLSISSTPLPPGSVSANSARTIKEQHFVFKEWERSVFVCNYESLFVRNAQGKKIQLKPEILSFLQACRHQPVTLLLDESHYIKDPEAQQTLALQAIKRELMCMSSSLHTYLLTGTPFTRGFIDVFNQLKFLGCQMTKTQFKDQFCVLGNIRGLLGWQQPIVGYKNVDKLYELIHKYALTLKSEDVLKLPEQVFTEHVHEPSPYFTLLTRERLPLKTILNINNARREQGLTVLANEDIEVLICVWEEEHGKELHSVSFDEALKSNLSLPNPWYRNIDYPETAYLCDTPGSMWMRARQLSIGFQGNAEAATWYDQTRLDEIRKLLTEHEDNYVVFYNYVPEFTELFDMCIELGYNIDVYNGDIKSLENYTRYVNEAPEARLLDKKNVILSNFASGSTGMNWQLYNQCIIASLPTYKHWAQGIKRVHRSGSTSTVFYHIFLSRTWLDRGMWETLMNGTEYSQEMFDKALNEAQI